MISERRVIESVMKRSAIIVLLLTAELYAVKIADITHLQGQRENRLTGLGLVVGLNGTGDGGKFLPAIKPLAAFLSHFGNPVLDLNDLKSAKNVALVTVEAVINKNGAREGQNLDVIVSAIGSCKSLKGGRLLTTPLLGPHKADMNIYALAAGPVVIDSDTPTSGTIKEGATMERDVIYNFISNDAITLVIDDAHASWSMASAVAMTINEAVSIQNAQYKIAKALDPKNVRVVIPKAERRNPANFIAWVNSLPMLMPEKQAKVTINSRTGTIVIDGNVTISPVTISYKGITISTEALLRRKLAKSSSGQDESSQEEFEMPEFVDLKLLTDAMDALQMEASDRIAIIRELARSGNLQGQLIEQR